MPGTAAQRHNRRMDPLHTVLLTVGLFAFTFLSPGPNLLVVVQASLAAGRTAGAMTGLGVATGDALYSGLGLFGMATLITAGGALFTFIQMAGGAYLAWYGWRLLRGSGTHGLPVASAPQPVAGWRHFRRGLCTDLANPQTVLFFAGIFSVTLRPDTPPWAKATAWLALVAASLLWRVLLCHLFSRPLVRRAYVRCQRALECLAGAGLALFGLRLAYEGWTRR